MEQGFDPEVKQYFKKIISSFSWGFLWLFAQATAGLYFRLGIGGEWPLPVTVTYYTLAVATLLLLLRYFYRLWRH